MRQNIFLVGLIVMMPFFSHSQYLEVGVFGGISSYLGDLAPVMFHPKELHGTAGVFARYNVHPFVSAKAGIYYGKISGNDENATKNYSVLRNLQFESGLFEISIHGEFNLIGYSPINRKVSPYLLGGISVFHFNPKAMYQGELIPLQPLNTEGQGSPEYPDRQSYNLWQYAIPFGAGVKFSVNPRWNINLEIVYHKTFTDYLDDVSTTYADPAVLIRDNGSLSAELANRTPEITGTPVEYRPNTQRGDPGDLDGYFFGGVNVSYNFIKSGKKSKAERCFQFK